MSHIFWISSYPKSGNTLLRAIISSLFFSKDGNFDFKMLNHTTQFEIRKRLNIIKKINSSDFLKLGDLKVLSKYWQTLQSKENMIIEDRFGFVKSHSCLVSMFNNWFTNEKFTTGYLYVVRDPRDIAISWAKHSGLNIDASIEFMNNYKSCIGWSETKSELPNKIIPKTYLGTWSDHVKSWSENNLDVPKLILRYEDLVYQKENNINKIVNFFKNSYNVKFENLDLKITNIIKSTDFNNLKNLEKKYGFKEANLGNFFRKGEKNQWKYILTNSQIKKIENNFRDFMNKFSYE
tara:strand:+ start:347 stop:1222 length:876 start_codon:yes stop_codon:yes gene_type:complete